MNRQAGVIVALIAVAGLAGAYSLGVFDAPADPASTTGVVDAPAPAAVSATAPAPAGTPAAAARPVVSRPTPPVPAPPTEAAPVVPTTATLHINSDVPGAQVFVDNKFVGTAPTTIDGVAPGQRKVNVQAPGYEGVAEFFNVEPGTRDIMISLRTIRLDQKIAVTHKHRIGSCSGTLIATPAGIRYETTNKDDGFEVSLTSIETFEADFLQKNLRIRIRGGRTYDFTDPSGKAEALYLFHQEVDKVRRRLLDEGR